MTQSPDYQRGYAAGKRYADHAEANSARDHARHIARMALAASIAPKIIDHPWRRKSGDEWISLNNAAGIADTVTEIVLAIEGKL